jgi:hypothetical protein
MEYISLKLMKSSTMLKSQELNLEHTGKMNIRPMSVINQHVFCHQSFSYSIFCWVNITFHYTFLKVTRKEDTTQILPFLTTHNFQIYGIWNQRWSIIHCNYCHNYSSYSSCVSLKCLFFPYSHVYTLTLMFSPYLFTGLLNTLNFMLASATYVHTTAFSISATFLVMFWLSDLA